MEQFLLSGKVVDYDLEVITDRKQCGIDCHKIGDIISQKNGELSHTQWLSIREVPEGEATHKRFDLSGGKLFAMMSPSPDPQMTVRRQRDVIYISGGSGSGKSTWTGQYARAWQQWIKQKVIVISAVNEDPAFEGVKLKRIPFDKLVDEEGNPNNSLQIEHLKESLVIFDDIDVISNKKLRLWIQELRNRCLEIGRHHNISIICTTHQLMNYRETKILLMEATKVVVFPNRGGAAQIKRYFKTYAELSPAQIKEIFSLKSRWVMLNKSCPRYILHANGAYILSDIV